VVEVGKDRDNDKGKYFLSVGLEMKKRENHDIMKKVRNPKLKKFVCPELNFEKLVNLGVFHVRPAKIGLNFEISRRILMTSQNIKVQY
jgi:hypothetical protein